MDEKEFYIDKDGFRIHAKLAIPGDRTVEKMMQPGAERLPLVIVVHGLTSADRCRGAPGGAVRPREDGWRFFEP